MLKFISTRWLVKKQADDISLCIKVLTNSKTYMN